VSGREQHEQKASMRRRTFERALENMHLHFAAVQVAKIAESDAAEGMTEEEVLANLRRLGYPVYRRAGVWWAAMKKSGTGSLGNPERRFGKEES
jgi:hypothetical protein